jgi:uncharacterized membrane protein YphA (DoxX/SURF4 family)
MGFCLGGVYFWSKSKAYMTIIAIVSCRIVVFTVWAVDGFVSWAELVAVLAFVCRTIPSEMADEAAEVAFVTGVFSTVVGMMSAIGRGRRCTVLG